MKKIIGFISLVFILSLVGIIQDHAYAGPPEEIQTLNDTWLSDITNGFTCDSSEVIGSDIVTLYLDSDATVGYWIEFTASEDEGLIGFDLTSVTLAKYEDVISQSLSFTVTATKTDMSTETASFVWEADDGSSKVFPLNMIGIKKFRIEVTDEFDAYNLEYREFTIANPVNGNNPPIVSNFTSTHFFENTVNSIPQQIDSDITVSDMDSSDFEGGQVVVSYSGTGLGEDQLSIGSVGNISLSGSDVLYASVGIIGSISGGTDGSNLIITLNASATPLNVTELLRSITYRNTSNEPTSYRTVAITVNDGDGGTSLTATAQIAISGEYDSGVEFTKFFQDTNIVWLADLNNGFTVTAAEGVTIQSDYNTIYMESFGPSGSMNIRADEQLIGCVYDLSSIDFSIDNSAANTYMLNLTGYKGNGEVVITSITGITQADFSLIDLSAFTEISSFDYQVTRITGSKSISAIGIDSITISNPKIYSGNSSPQIINLTDITFLENNVNASFSQIDSDVTFADSDSADLDGGTIIVSYQGSAISEDQLWVSNTSNITVSGNTIYHSVEGSIASISGGSNGANLIITMNSKSTPSIATEILRALSYKNTSDEPTTYRTIIIHATDGDGGNALAASAKISVWGQAESGVEIPSLTQNLHRYWNLDLNNGFSSTVSAGVMSGDSSMIWFINDNLGTITFTADEQFYGGMFDLVGIEFDVPALSTDSYTIIVTGHTKYGTTVTSSISGVNETQINSIELSNMNEIVSFDITITGSRRILIIGIVSFTIDNPEISNNAPAFTSPDTFSISELADADGTILLDINANNGESGGNDEELTYNITGGTAQGLFTINPSTGEIALNATGASSLDYESISSYTLTVSADDGKIINNITNQTITINLLNEDDEAPAITSNGGGAAAIINMNENTTDVTTVTADDVDTIGDLLYTISGGVDAASFIITSEGKLSFVSAPDYEIKKYYQVNIEVSDGVRRDSQSIEVHILDVNEYAPVINSNSGRDIASIPVNENTIVVTTVIATDGDTEDTIIYEIVGGADFGSFIINSSTGELTFLTPPDYETKSEYSVVIRASDGTKEDFQSLFVNIINIDETAPVITSDGGGDSALISINENTTAVTTITATDTELLGILTYSITGGLDRTVFQIDETSGELTFITAPDYEAKSDYEVIIGVSDGENRDSQRIQIIVLNLNDNNPVITSDGGGLSANINVAENNTAVTTITATDLDELGILSFSINGGADFTSFRIKELTGELTFIEAPDYEIRDYYEVIIDVTDGTFHDSQILNVNVINQNDNAPIITSYEGEEEVQIFIEENRNRITYISASDVDELEAIRYSLSGVDASEMRIDSLSGLLSFMYAADYERKKTYEVTITASDGIHTDEQMLHITIIDVDEEIPVIVDEMNDNAEKVNTDLVIRSDYKLILAAEKFKEMKNENKDITITIKDQDGRDIYKWIFTKENLLSSPQNITDVDLTISISQVPDNDKISNNLGDVNGLVLSFGHDGTLPAQATVKIYVGDQEGVKPGDQLYLYHFNHESGKLETLPFSTTFIVDEEGYLTITILHCSDYVALSEEAESKLITSLKNQISINPIRKTVYLGDNIEPICIRIKLPETLELVETLKDKTSQPMIGGVKVTYSSSNTQVAIIDGKGSIKVIGVGKADIITEFTLYNGKTKVFKTEITVKEPHLKITAEINNMKVGEAFTFKAYAYGLDSDDITWTTSAKSIVAINKKTGRATAISKGTDYVIATVSEKQVKIKVTVK